MYDTDEMRWAILGSLLRAQVLAGTVGLNGQIQAKVAFEFESVPFEFVCICQISLCSALHNRLLSYASTKTIVG